MLTENQRKILELARKRDISKMGFREIARELEIKNPQTVIYHIEKLKEKGLLYIDQKTKKQKVAEANPFTANNLFSLPILGQANCGDALEYAEENISGYLNISPRILNRTKPSGLFVIRAVGNSLNMANLNGLNVEDGDYVIVDRNKQPSNGDYVLSIINGAANFKKFFKDNTNKEIRLVSESIEENPPIILHIDDIETSCYMVNGVAIKVIKN